MAASAGDDHQDLRTMAWIGESTVEYTDLPENCRLIRRREGVSRRRSLQAARIRGGRARQRTRGREVHDASESARRSVHVTDVGTEYSIYSIHPPCRIAAI